MTIFLRLWDMVGKLTGTIILTPIHYTVGNCAESIYFGLLKARSEQKKLVILYTYRLPGKLQFRSWTDIEFTNVESEYRLKLNKWVYTFLRVLITAYYAFFRIVSLMWRLLFGHHISELYTMPIIGYGTLWQPEEQMEHFSWDIVAKYDWRGQIEKPLQVSLGKQKRMLAEDQRVRMGLPSDAWFVCLHVREGGFYNDQCDERNANIFNYIDAIEEITRRGGWVIRMGDSTMTKLPVMEHVIDYPFTEFKGPLMDMYLISECRVYMGMYSGILDVAILFERPVITTNITNWLFNGLVKRCDIGLFKHVYSKSRNRFLSIREWLAEPFDALYFLTGGDDYIYYENDPQELKAVVKEFFDRGDNWQPTPLQNQFNKLRLQYGKKMITDTSFTHDITNTTHYRYRLASRFDSALGIVGAEFLQNNFDKCSR